MLNFCLCHYFLFDFHVIPILEVSLIEMFLLYAAVLCLWFYSTSSQCSKNDCLYQNPRILFVFVQRHFNVWSEKAVAYSWQFSYFLTDLVPCMTYIDKSRFDETIWLYESRFQLNVLVWINLRWWMKLIITQTILWSVFLSLNVN